MFVFVRKDRRSRLMAQMCAGWGLKGSRRVCTCFARGKQKWLQCFRDLGQDRWLRVLYNDIALFLPQS